VCSPEKKPWTRRIQPYVGVLIVTIGLTPLLLAATSGFSLANLQPFFGGLLLVGGGAKLIHMGTTGPRSFWLVFLTAIALTLVIVWLVAGYASETLASSSSKSARMSPRAVPFYHTAARFTTSPFCPCYSLH
jgi:hypothetical protein